jgi:hypothetical protein
MLPPEGRVLLTEALRPEPGWRCEHAVATTFTLDLASVLLVPLAFAGHRLAEEPDPVEVMEAVRASAADLDVFCQAGSMHMPRQASALFAFLEPAVHQVSHRRGLFHPKLWLRRYTADGETSRYRLLVLSRNLTGDRSWDTCLRLDGVAGFRRDARNRGLAELLRWLPRHALWLPEARAERIEALAEETRRIEWENPEGVTELAFHTPGIGGQTGPDFSGSRHLVISPFCNGEGLDIVAPPDSREVTVVSRQEELDRLPAVTRAAIHRYVLSALASLEQDEENLLVGLHAKVYVIEYGQQAQMLVGSANATEAAWRGNVELVAELRGGRKALGIDALWNAGDPVPFSELLEPYAPQDAEPEDETGQALDELLRRIATVPLTARVSRSGERHRLDLSSDEPVTLPDGVTVTAELLTKPGQACRIEPDVPVKAVFGGLRLVDVTPFVLLRASAAGEERSAVVKAALLGDPAERLDEILARQIDTPEKFLRFLMLLLGLAGTDMPLAGGGAAARDGSWSAHGGGPELFELLCRALVERPDALDTMAGLVSRLQATETGRTRLPDGFAELWTVVDEARHRIGSEASA